MRDFKASLKDSITDNPIQAILAVIALVSLATNLFLGFENYRLQQEVRDTKKPFVDFPDYQVKEGADNIDFKFYVKNPSDLKYFVDLGKGGCPTGNELIRVSSYNETTEPKDEEIFTSGQSIKAAPSQKIGLDPQKSIDLTCRGYEISNVSKNTLMTFQTCIGIAGISSPICDSSNVEIIDVNEAN